MRGKTITLAHRPIAPEILSHVFLFGACRVRSLHLYKSSRKSATWAGAVFQGAVRVRSRTILGAIVLGPVIPALRSETGFSMRPKIRKKRERDDAKVRLFHFALSGFCIALRASEFT